MQLVGKIIRDNLGKELRADVLANKYYNDKDAAYYLKGERIPIAKDTHPFSILWPTKGKPWRWVYLFNVVNGVRNRIIQFLIYEQWNISFIIVRNSNENFNFQK